MILKDKITVRTGGGRDPKGDPIPTVDRGPFPAQVTPLRSSEAVEAGQPPLTAYYRLIIGPIGGAWLTPTGVVKWRGKTYTVQGDVEPWNLGGRIHHFEATVRYT